jgi:hypothetical protein
LAGWDQHNTSALSWKRELTASVSTLSDGFDGRENCVTVKPEHTYSPPLAQGLPGQTLLKENM